MGKNMALLMMLTLSVTATFGQVTCKMLDGRSVNNPLNVVGTVKLQSLSKNDVFNKIASWGSIKIPATEAAYISDRELGIIKGVMRINYTYKKGFRFILYNIILQAKDGEFDFTLNNFLMNKKPMEQYLIEKKDDRYYNQSFEDICLKIEGIVKELTEIK